MKEIQIHDRHYPGRDMKDTLPVVKRITDENGVQFSSLYENDPRSQIETVGGSREDSQPVRESNLVEIFNRNKVPPLGY